MYPCFIAVIKYGYSSLVR